ncbi:hypothetical protein BGZ97_010443 [Linnemannia gamsii]|uniref:Uncharacterized protein n=1 Tax=Linnemannia gamsii TaxID=64522 RepID=A0A9P6R6V2_9FUNG|nr:hypothetical protein BGZ97_010443 [Linnemannia gamsii]
MYCSERCYIVDGMAYYYQAFSNSTNTAATCPFTAASTATATSSTSNWSLRMPEYDTIDFDYYHDPASPQVRKNKTLPPPTLSPILLPTPCQTTRRTTSTTMTKTRSRSSSVLSTSSCSAESSSSSSGSSMNTSVSGGGGGGGTNSGSSSDDGEDDPLSTNWPKMDRLAFSSSPFDRHLSSNGRAEWDPISLGWTTTSDTLPSASPSCTRSELPPPASAWVREEDLTLSSPSPRKYLALSASIWGPGWHQVEPLPPSFVKTLEQSELELQAQAQALALEKAALAAANPKAIAKKAKREAKAAAAAAAALAAAAAAAGQDQGNGQVQDTVMTGADSCPAVATVSMADGAGPAPPNALCSSRLPRSLQFVD